MEFIVSRTSIENGDDSPCKEAYRKIYKRDNLPVDYWPKETEAWFIRLNSLEELLDFVDKYDRIILTRDCNKSWWIEIYDDYRE